MPAIYPSTALKNQQREIKSKADAEIVYITENGWGKYVFMSEAVLDATVEQAVQDSLYKERIFSNLANIERSGERIPHGIKRRVSALRSRAVG